MRELLTRRVEAEELIGFLLTRFWPFFYASILPGMVGRLRRA